MTGWLREIRQACDLAAKEQGREKRLVIRIAGSLEGNRSLGMDLETWIREELVDSVIAMPVTHGYGAGTPELRESGRGRQGHQGLGSGRHQQLRATPQDTREVFAAAAANAYAGRSRRRALPHLLPRPRPLSLRRLGHGIHALHGLSGRAGPQGQALPYRKQSQAGHSPPSTESPGSSPWSWSPERGGRTFTWKWPTTWRPRRGEGELWRCELQVMVRYMMHTDKVKLWWNGKEIPEARWRKADWTYQMRPRPEALPGIPVARGPAR